MPSWHVYNENINAKGRDKIEIADIFNYSHCFREGFVDQVVNLGKKISSSDINLNELIKEFDKKVEGELMYAYWAKCEYEILITPWICPKPDESRKVDIYEQVMINKDRFFEYVNDFVINTFLAKKLRELGFDGYQIN
jgi:hypothetical protein